MDNFPELRSSRLLLRRFTSADTPQVFAGLSHPEVIKYYGVSYQTLDDTCIQMDWFRELETTGTGIWWAVCEAASGTFWGAGGLNNLNKQHRKAEIGFWLLPQHQGKGVMTEAMPLIIDYAFRKLKLHRIEATIETKNGASIAATKKAGFLYEGTMHECEWKDGEPLSLDMYALLNIL